MLLASVDINEGLHVFRHVFEQQPNMIVKPINGMQQRNEKQSEVCLYGVSQ